ncbi:zliS Lysozyme family protein [uncultured Caudovirales phage]|uniref:ZliS Lysozyme family protein n=1 Tax=uncultured Caudovirales phage TaxID=2100421 RepID=A0A6J5LI59_9CAUD|nr:zliS Lysozyme family protein [uncultured Caudovirales phage]
MDTNFDQCLAYLLKHEGGYVNHPADPGGRTNLGVTQKVWEEWVGHPITEADMRALGPKDVAPLYKKKYWDSVSGGLLPSGVDYTVFDLAVNSGVGRAAKILQKAVGVNPDGAIGPATLGAVSECDPAELIMGICRTRQAFLESLQTFSTFGKGWTRRVNEVQATALKMYQEPELPLTRSNV